MKIIYVNPGKIQAGLDYVIKGPPLALLTISAMVPEHEATLFDFKVDRYNEKRFRALLRKHKVCAITSMTPQIGHALEVAQMAKEEGCITIIGGYHPTLEPDFVASNTSIDFCVRGEGEHTFREIIDYIDGNKNGVAKSAILGLSWRNEAGLVIHNTTRPLEPNLDNFPIPRRDLLRGKKYSYMGTKVNLCETSRGCPHKCAFCCIIRMWADPSGKVVYRTKSVKRVIEEVYSIDQLKGQKWDFIFFNDDNFTIDIKRTDKILDALIKSRMAERYHFSCQTRVDTLSRNPWLAPKMQQAGFKQVFLGIESVHQQSLDKMNKHTNIEMIRTACKMAQSHGISIFAGIIIGFPGETVEMVRQTIAFTQELNPEFVQFTPITAFPGTPFFDQMKAEHKIATYDWKYYNLFHSMMRTDQLSRNEMYGLVAEAYAKFYMRPAYIGKMVKSTFTDPNFAWYKKISLKWLKQFCLGGWNMLHSQGISFDLVTKDKAYTNEFKHLTTRGAMKKRYQRFKQLLKQARSVQMVVKSPALNKYLPEQIHSV